MKVITAIENNKINEKLKKIKEIEILNPDIQYKEGILEYLEKNDNVELIIMKEDLQGQISIKELITEILKIKNNVRIIIFIEKNKNNKILRENRINNKKIKYIFTEKINEEEILKIINIKKEKDSEKSILFLGNRGSGKSIILYIIIYFLLINKNKKILIVDEDENKTLSKIYLKKIKNYKKNTNEKIKKNLYILNYKLDEKEEILKKINKIKKNFDYIFIETSSRNISKKYEKIINKKIIIIEPNILELQKIYEQIEENEKTEIILNKININSISTSTVEELLNKKIIGKIKYSENINLIINDNFNLKHLKKNERKNILKIIEKI